MATIINRYRPVVQPRLPAAPTEYSPEFIEQYSNILRLYFNQLDNLTGVVLGESGGRFIRFPYGAFSRDQDQTATVNTATLMTFNTKEGRGDRAAFRLPARGSARQRVDINNHRAKLRGAVSFWVQPGLKHNNHPLEVEAGRKALLLLRDANINHLRPAWYAPVMIDLCDELGMTTVPGGTWGLAGRTLSIVEAQELATWMVATHKSNPSAIMWSLANETWGPQYELMGRRFKELDRRPVGASTLLQGGPGGLPGLDLDNDHYPSNRSMAKYLTRTCTPVLSVLAFSFCQSHAR